MKRITPTPLAALAGALLLGALSPLATGFDTFADEDRSSQLSGEPVQQRYQFNTPTTVTYDRDSLGQGAASYASTWPTWATMRSRC